MSLADRLKEQGFKAEASSEGEWTPYNGIYRCKISTLRPEYDEKNASDYIQLELDIEEVLSGDMKRESKFPAFRKRYYIDWINPQENHLESAKELANVVFTGTGLELDFTNPDEFKKSAEKVIGGELYLRAWGFAFTKDRQGNEIPEADRKPVQFWAAMKKSVAEKKRTADSIAF